MCGRRWLTNFMAEPIKSYAMVAQAAVNLAQNPKDKAARARFARVGVTYVATAMATAAAAAAVDTLRHPRGDDEDDDERLTAASLAKVYAQNVLENFADGVNLPGNLPLLQDVIGYITERADGNATYTIKRNDVEWIGDVMDAVSVWDKYLTGKTTSLYQVLYRTANAVSNVTGVAVSAALRDVKGVYDTLTGLAGANDPLGMDKDLNRIALALDGGDADKASRLFAGQVDAKVKSGTEPRRRRDRRPQHRDEAVQQGVPAGGQRGTRRDAGRPDGAGIRRGAGVRFGHRNRLGRDGGQRRHHGGAGHGGRRRGAGDDRREGAAAGAGRRGSGDAGKPDECRGPLP